MPPVQPMLAKAVKGIPDPAKHGGLVFEPKWDGFRCLVFRDGDEVELASRNTKPLTRYFPEVVDAVRASLPQRCVLDGEIFVSIGDRLEFEKLQERIHPADSRVRMLAEKTPAGFVAFDLLALGDESLVGEPFEVRRARLAEALADVEPPIFLTRTTTDPAEAQEWFQQFEGAGLDGVVAKPLGATYQPNARTMLKIKHERTADVVVAGYRLHKTSTPEKPLLGSLLLGLYARRPAAAHRGVGVVHGQASRGAARRAAAAGVRGPLRAPLGRLERVGDREPRPGAGHAEPLERRQGPLVHPAAPGAGARGGLRPHGGQPVPAHRAVQALAPGPRPRVVRLRPAGGAGELRPGRGAERLTPGFDARGTILAA